jgi:hypothetical protein
MYLAIFKMNSITTENVCWGRLMDKFEIAVLQVRDHVTWLMVPPPPTCQLFFYNNCGCIKDVSANNEETAHDSTNVPNIV